MSSVNYKDKYLQLRQRFEESVDCAFRLGFEQGTQAAQMQQMQDQQQQLADQQAQQAQLAAQGMGQDDGSGPNGASGQEDQPGQPGAQIQGDSRGVGQQTGAAGAPQGLGGSELDNHINELEGLMAKSEYGTAQWETLKKSVDNLKSIKVSFDIKKNAELIKSIGQNIKKPLTFSARANHNLSAPAKEAISTQHKIVSELMDHWDKEEKGLPSSILEVLQSESLTKKE